jgi:hypothetical protein
MAARAAGDLGNVHGDPAVRVAALAASVTRA